MVPGLGLVGEADLVTVSTAAVTVAVYVPTSLTAPLKADVAVRLRVAD